MKVQMCSARQHFFLSQRQCAHIIINEPHNTRRKQGLTVTSAPSLRRCPDWPSATTCGHRLWDWTLPHGSRKQRTHSTQLYFITVSNSNHSALLRPARNRARFPTEGTFLKICWAPHSSPLLNLPLVGPVGGSSLGPPPVHEPEHDELIYDEEVLDTWLNAI